MHFRDLRENAQTPRVLYHGTTAGNLAKIRRNGMNTKSFWTPDQNMAWYFADMAQDMGGEGEQVVIPMSINAFDSSAFVIDNAMWQEPVDGVAEFHGFDDEPSAEWDNLIYDIWSRTHKTWLDSLMVLRSVIYTKPLPPELFSNTVTESAGVKLPRRWRGNVGKSIGGSIYVHRDYETEVVPDDVLVNAQKQLDGFDYNIVKYVPKTGAVTFIQSPDFDKSPEPMVGPQLLVKPDGSKRLMRPSGDPWIYHHKWLWVRDDYPGFDVKKAKRRSAAWMSLPDIDYSRIGKKSFWEKFVVPRIP